jgi:hypothetical protein
VPWDVFRRAEGTPEEIAQEILNAMKRDCVSAKGTGGYFLVEEPVAIPPEAMKILVQDPRVVIVATPAETEPGPEDGEDGTGAYIQEEAASQLGLSVEVFRRCSPARIGPAKMAQVVRRLSSRRTPGPSDLTALEVLKASAEDQRKLARFPAPADELSLEEIEAHFERRFELNEKHLANLSGRPSAVVQAARDGLEHVDDCMEMDLMEFRLMRLEPDVDLGAYRKAMDRWQPMTPEKLRRWRLKHELPEFVPVHGFLRGMDGYLKGKFEGLRRRPPLLMHPGLQGLLKDPRTLREFPADLNGCTLEQIEELYQEQLDSLHEHSAKLKKARSEIAQASAGLLDYVTSGMRSDLAELATRWDRFSRLGQHTRAEMTSQD